LRVGSAFSEGRGEGCVWSPSKDLIFFFRVDNLSNNFPFENGSFQLSSRKWLLEGM